MVWNRASPDAAQQVAQQPGIARQAFEFPAEPAGAAARVIRLGIGSGHAEMDESRSIVRGLLLPLGLVQEFNIIQRRIFSSHSARKAASLSDPGTLPPQFHPGV